MCTHSSPDIDQCEILSRLGANYGNLEETSPNLEMNLTQTLIGAYLHCALSPMPWWPVLEMGVFDHQLSKNKKSSSE